MDSVRSTWSIACPRCGDDSELDITASVDVRLAPDGAAADEAFCQDQEWDDDSPIMCVACGWTGKVSDFRIKEDSNG